MFSFLHVLHFARVFLHIYSIYIYVLTAGLSLCTFSQLFYYILPSFPTALRLGSRLSCGILSSSVVKHVALSAPPIALCAYD